MSFHIKRKRKPLKPTTGLHDRVGGRHRPHGHHDHASGRRRARPDEGGGEGAGLETLTRRTP